MNKRTVGTKVYESMDEYERLALALYDNEIQKRMDDPEMKRYSQEESLRYARGYLGDEVKAGSGYQRMMEHFLIGLDIGLKIGMMGADKSDKED